MTNTDINTDYFYRFIDKLKLSKDETLYILDLEGNVILSTNKKQNGTRLSDKELRAALTDKEESGMFSGKVSKKQSIISFSKSSYNDWRYVSVLSVDSYYQKTAQMRMIITIALLLLLPIIAAISVFLTKAAHKPLLKVLNYIRSNPEHDGSRDQNEYKMLEDTFKGLNDKVDDLSSRLEANKPLLRHNAVLRLLKGTENADETVERELADIKFEGTRICCFILKLFYKDEQSIENRLLDEYNIIDVMTNQCSFSVKPIIDDSGRIAAIVDFKDDTDTEKVEQGLFDAVHAVTSVSFSICIGNTYEFNPENIHKSYLEAVQAFKYSFIKCRDPVLRFAQLKTARKQPISQTKNFNRFGEMIKAGEEESACQFVKSVLRDIIQGGYSITSTKNILLDMVTVVRMALNDLGLDENELLGGDIRDCFDRIDTIFRFEEWITDVCSRVIRRVIERKGSIARGLESKVENYIRQNLCHDISLNSVADALSISPGYLGNIFKGMFGTNFSDFVVSLKMEEAARLLRENKQTVKEISNMLGYSSVQYFIRIFKEKYGYTPKLYQKTVIYEK